MNDERIFLKIEFNIKIICSEFSQVIIIINKKYI